MATGVFTRPEFPRSARYNPDWMLASLSSSANALWMTEWLTGAMDLKPGMRVLDLGCGRAASSIFLHREFGVQVWATDLWFSAAENARRIADAGAGEAVFPVHANARSLPFADGFFDAIVSIDSFPYYGSDDLYLNYLARFLKPGGQLGIAGAGLMHEILGPLPDHLRPWWTQSHWCLHSAHWWRRHWERTGIIEVDLADNFTEGWRLWLDWHQVIAPDNHVEIEAVKADQGRYLGYIRLTGRRRENTPLDEEIVSIPFEYLQRPLMKQD